MRKKLLLGAILLSLLSANSFAIEIHGGKLLSHKEWTKGNVINSSFIDTKSSITRKASSFLPGTDINEIRVIASTTPLSDLESNIQINKSVTFTGTTMVTIQNHDSTPKSYTITSFQQVREPCSSLGCISKLVINAREDKIILDPQGYAFMERIPTLTTSFSTIGFGEHEVDVRVRADDTATTIDAPGISTIFRVTE